MFLEGKAIVVWSLPAKDAAPVKGVSFEHSAFRQEIQNVNSEFVKVCPIVSGIYRTNSVDMQTESQ